MSQGKIETSQIMINPYKIAKILGFVGILLIIASIGRLFVINLTELSYNRLILFDVDSEQSLPTYFSSFLLLFAALILFIITIIEKNRTTSMVYYWATLSICFLYLAIDEALSFHERLISPMNRLLEIVNLNIVIHNFSWIIPVLAVLVIFAIFFLRFFFRLNPKTRYNFFIAALFFIGGSVIMELIGGRFFVLRGYESLSYQISAHVEEIMEMVGEIIFIWALLIYISESFIFVQFKFQNKKMQSLNMKDLLS